MTPVYGLAECAVGLAVPPLGRGPLIDRIQREPFLRAGRALPTSKEDPHALRFVSCGSALPGHEMGVVDERGREAPERTVGRLEFCGPSATSGYFRNAEETQRLFHGDWLDRGDLAYLANGEVYLTSRAKDMIVRGGHNIYPYQLEEAIASLLGIRKGCVAIFGIADAVAATKRLVVVAETRENEANVLTELRRKINAVAVDLLGTPPDDVVLAPPHSVLKTSSGKIRRSATHEFYQSGALGNTRHRSASWQLVRLAFAGMRTRLHRFARTTIELLYSLYAWGLFCILAPVIWAATALTRSPAFDWSITGIVARWFLRSVAIRLDVEGLHLLPPESPCIVVANHASYLDGLVLIAALPRPLGFVAKREFRQYLLTRLYLEGIGAEFVERFEIQRGVEDTRRLTLLAKRKRSLFFFPEGTFTRAPGLAPFHMGAFLIAAEANLPVIPVGLRGTRFVLPDHSWLPRRGSITVHIGTPITPSGSD